MDLGVVEKNFPSVGEHPVVAENQIAGQCD